MLCLFWYNVEVRIPPPEKIYPGTYYRVVTPVMYISVESPVLSLVYIRQENHAWGDIDMLHEIMRENICWECEKLFIFIEHYFFPTDSNYFIYFLYVYFFVVHVV